MFKLKSGNIGLISKETRVLFFSRLLFLYIQSVRLSGVQEADLSLLHFPSLLTSVDFLPVLWPSGRNKVLRNQNLYILMFTDIFMCMKSSPDRISGLAHILNSTNGTRYQVNTVLWFQTNSHLCLKYSVVLLRTQSWTKLFPFGLGFLSGGI